jgi:hypothetical protein
MGIGADPALYHQEGPHKALGYQKPGPTFQAVVPERGLLEHSRGRLPYFDLIAAHCWAPPHYSVMATDWTVSLQPDGPS